METDRTHIEAAGLRRAITEAVARIYGLRMLTSGLFLAGVVTLVVRFADPGARIWILGCVSAGIALVASAIGVASALRRSPPIGVCVSALDAKSEAGGLFMCAGEDGAEAWKRPAERVPEVVTSDMRPVATMVALALAFAVLPLVLPQSAFSAVSAELIASIENIVERELAKTAEMREEDLLPEETAAAISEEIERLAKNAGTADTARVLEALDHISNELNRAAEESIGAIAEERMALQAANAVVSALTEALQNGAFSESDFAGGDMKAALSSLADFVAAMPFSDETREALEKMLADCEAGASVLDEESMKKLAEFLQQCDAAQAGRLARMADMKSLDPRTLDKLRQACENGGSCTNSGSCSASLAAMLAAYCEGGEEGENGACDVSVLTESWGISRGDAPPAPLTWTEQVSKEGTGFNDEFLSMPDLPPLESAQLIGVSASAPEVADVPAEVGGGALDSSGEKSGTTAAATVLPRHRDAVKHYFSR